MVKEFVTERLRLIDLYPDKAKSVAKEYGLKEDEVELIRKGRISTEPVIDRDARTVINYISTDALDRDNEVIEHRGVVLDDYRKNPIVPWAHNYHGLPIGKNIWIKSDKKGLVAKTHFLRHDFAQDVFDLYTEDIAGTGPALKAWSVGFIPLKWKNAKPDEKVAEDERPQTVRRTYKKWLLLEYSAVPVPSNPEALTLMVEKGLIKDKKLVKDIEDFIIETEKAKKYSCECVKCGWKTETDKHCKDLKCDECGGQMRRVERPGPGQESSDNESAKEIILKPEETDDFIRIPVRDCKVTATITISAGQGITALYCGKIKKIRTYIFSKKDPYNWTMKKAQAWVKEHGKEIDDFTSKWQEITDTEKMNDTALEALGEQIGFIIEGILGFEGKELEEKEEKDKELKEGYAVQGLAEMVEELKDEMREIKEGRVLSGKNLKLVKDCKEQIDKVGELLGKLIVASEPPKEESILPLIEDNKVVSTNAETKEKSEINTLTKDDVPVIVEEVLNGLSKAMSGQQKEIQKLFDKKRGKVS